MPEVTTTIARGSVFISQNCEDEPPPSALMSKQSMYLLPKKSSNIEFAKYLESPTWIGMIKKDFYREENKMTRSEK